MKSRFALLLAFSTIAAGPSPTMAHGGEAREATSKHDVEHTDKSHNDVGKGHAAALGRPADTRFATRTIEVVMSDNMRFEPRRIDIKLGETIRFSVRNDGNVKHEMVLGTTAELKKHAALMARFPEMEHEDPNAVSVAPGMTGEFAWTFTKPGTFDFACLIPGHFEAGMKGKIQVKK